MPQKGIVKFFNSEKGYGFIRPEDGGSDLFVHISAVSQSGLVSLEQGQVVGYELEPDKKGKGSKSG